MPDQTGTLCEIFAEVQITERMSKREFILQIKASNPQYDQFVKFDLINDKTDLCSPYQQGDQIKVHYNLKGRKYNDKFYNTLEAWRIERI